MITLFYTSIPLSCSEEFLEIRVIPNLHKGRISLVVLSTESWLYYKEQGEEETASI